MYIETVPNRKSKPAILLRESRREGRRVIKTTLANLTNWPDHMVEGLKLLLKGNKMTTPDQVFTPQSSLPHGHVEAVLGVIKDLGLDQMISSKPCRERSLVVALIAARLLHSGSKLETTRLWKNSTLAQEMQVEDADTDEIYDALEWLHKRQERIEKKLAKRFLGEEKTALYDVSGSYYEGKKCSLTAFGYNRDQKKGKQQIVYGLMTNGDGCPVSIQVYPGNTSDPKTVPDQVEKLRHQFGLEKITLIGDRGMLTQTRIDDLKSFPKLGWISALKSSQIRKLIEKKDIQLTLFDEDRNLMEITSTEHPEERLVVCYNSALAEKRRRKRNELLEETEKRFKGIENQINRRTKTPLKACEIALKIGKISHKYKMNKHFIYTIEDNHFEWKRNEESIESESQLDGLYVIRSNEKNDRLSSQDLVRHYKRLSQVEQAFRAMKSDLIKVRPIYHRLEKRIKGHLFLCMLAYLVQHEMKNRLASLLYADEEVAVDRDQRDPVAPAQPSLSARTKRSSKTTTIGMETHTFKSLLKALGQRAKVILEYHHQDTGSQATLSSQQVISYTTTELQKQAFKLLGLKCAQ